MPFSSSAQRRAMYAAAQGTGTLGIPRKAALSFIRDSAVPVKHVFRHAPTSVAALLKRSITK